MRLAVKASRSVVVLLLSFVLTAALMPGRALGQSHQQSPPVTSQSIIDRAEALVRDGEQAQAKGLPDIARKMFDQAVDTILQSGINLREDAKLEAYYR
ncbi:MAG TPA: hypothetical protein VNI02_08945, partial [Blastocatellia bacterium]|nr:hypothetical protein [Blastocatellia bacterium]